MKKLLLCSAAVAGMAFAAPAFAQEGGVKLNVAGTSKGYVAYVDQDEAAGFETRNVDILRETEIHFTGETTLDNGLTVGAHFESDLDNGGGDTFNTEESYVYFSGQWGRMNFGKEDGAAFLLQVAAPSADNNIDGLRQLINPINFEAAGVADLDLIELDYDQDVSDYDNKLTYLTPVYAGFQAGVSYTPEADDNDENTRGTNGVNLEEGTGFADGDFGSVYDAAVRYEGAFDQVGFAVGAGYSFAELDKDIAAGGLDDRQAWNIGADLDFGPFGFGVVYTQDDMGYDDDADRDVLVVGADYTLGAYKFGASYMNLDQETTGVVAGGTLNGLGAVTGDVEVDRYTGGVTYTYGPGMTFRGSVSYADFDVGATELDATSVLVGTQIDF